MNKFSKEELLAIFAIWVEQIKEEFPTSKYATFTVADFFEEFQNSPDLSYFYPNLYLSLDHYSFLPTRKEIKRKQNRLWLRPLQALLKLM